MIKIIKGTYQSDSLYTYDKNRQYHHTHNFFVDDLKLLARNMSSIKSLLDIVTLFSKDIGMKFGVDKGAFFQIEKSKLIQNPETFIINDLIIKPLPIGDTYTYLGIDENITYDGPMNKARITKEYLSRVKKIWSSELSDYNKVVAYNRFATPIITPTVGMIDWTVDDIEQLDINTRKVLSMTGNLHPNSDIDYIYVSRSNGGRGIKQIQTVYESRIIAVRQHLLRNNNRSSLIQYIINSEEQDIIRVGKGLLDLPHINDDINKQPRLISKTFTKSKNLQHEQNYTNKKMHCYFQKKLINNDDIDQKLSCSRTKNRSMTSHFEGYLAAIRDQEIPTKFLKQKRQIDTGITPSGNNKCRLCKSNVEDVNHIISSCNQMSARYYLPLRYDVIAPNVLKMIIKKNHQERHVKRLNEPEYVIKIYNHEYWWNMSIKTATKIPQNRPDLFVWDTDQKICQIIEFSCPCDVNLSGKTSDKINTYGPLIRNLQISYPQYRFKMIPIITGALGYVVKSLIRYVKQLGFDKKDAIYVIRKLQSLATAGTIKIRKTFLKFNGGT